MNKIILASNSPRRKKILSDNGYKLIVIPSDYNENICNKIYSKELVENCAFQKALDVKKRNESNFPIVGADTVVVSDNIILGKPKNKNEAHKMLKSLSDKTHFVATSVCIIKEDKIIKDTGITYVTFRKLKDEEIDSYINSKNPLDKAGSYGIQDEGFDFCTSIDGELDNVIGFPLKLFEKMLLSADLKI